MKKKKSLVPLFIASLTFLTALVSLISKIIDRKSIIKALQTDENIISVVKIKETKII